MTLRGDNMKKQFIKNAVILTVVSLFMRTVSFSFNVYIANKIGSSGMGLFALIMSVYGFGVTVSSSGINLASTKVVSEEIAKGKNKKEATKKCILYALCFGFFAFVIIYFGADFFARKIIGDIRIKVPLMILSVSLPCVSVTFAMAGYFNATAKIYKSSLVQITEQIIKILCAVAFLGMTDQKNAENSCIALVMSGTISEIVSCFIMTIIYLFDIRNEKTPKSNDLTKRVMRYGLPVAVSAYLRSLLSTTEHALIPKSLEKFCGAKDTALSSYGVVHGMVMPMIFLPSGIVSSVSMLLVPEITKLNKLKKMSQIDKVIEKCLSLTLVFSVGAAGILYFYADQIGMLFYKNHEASYYLKIIAPLAAVMYADGVVDAVLKGLNQEVHAMRYDIVLSAVSLFLIVTLIPTKGVVGYIAIIYISEMINAYLSINRLMEVSNFDIKPISWMIIPAAAIVFSCIIGKTIVKNSFASIAFSIVLYVVAAFTARRKPPLQNRRIMIK